jgi:hypothetical protein
MVRQAQIGDAIADRKIRRPGHYVPNVVKLVAGGGLELATLARWITWIG